MATKGDQLELHEVRFDIPEGDPSGLSLVRLAPSFFVGLWRRKTIVFAGYSYIFVRGKFIYFPAQRE